MMFTWRNTIYLGLCLVFLSVCDDAAAGESRKKQKALGKNTYMASCEACHMMGKNVLKPGKDIVVSSKLASKEEFKSFLSEGRGLMPAFKKIADDEIVVDALYRYTKTLKNQNWSYEPPLDDSPTEPIPPPQKKQREKDERPAG